MRTPSFCMKLFHLPPFEMLFELCFGWSCWKTLSKAASIAAYQPRIETLGKGFVQTTAESLSNMVFATSFPSLSSFKLVYVIVCTHSISISLAWKLVLESSFVCHLREHGLAKYELTEQMFSFLWVCLLYWYWGLASGSEDNSSASSLISLLAAVSRKPLLISSSQSKKFLIWRCPLKLGRSIFLQRSLGPSS